MIPRIKRRIYKFLPALNPSKLVSFEIPINACVHFSAIRFGVNGSHPFEKYLFDIRDNKPVRTARRELIDFLRHYRPRHMGEALGIELSKQYPLWLYPWKRTSPKLLSMKTGWVEDPSACPDIMTHFSEIGISSYRLDEQFCWLERAFDCIGNDGYQPDQHQDYITVRKFQRQDGEASYLLLDGNHRVAALSALGCKSVVVEMLSGDIYAEEQAQEWPGVQSGYYSFEDSLKMFNAFFDGNQNYQTTPEPAPILGPPGWLDLYSSE